MDKCGRSFVKLFAKDRGRTNTAGRIRRWENQSPLIFWRLCSAVFSSTCMQDNVLRGWHKRERNYWDNLLEMKCRPVQLSIRCCNPLTRNSSGNQVPQECPSGKDTFSQLNKIIILETKCEEKKQFKIHTQRRQYRTILPVTFSNGTDCILFSSVE